MHQERRIKQMRNKVKSSIHKLKLPEDSDYETDDIKGKKRVE